MSNQSEWISKDFGPFKLRFRPYTLTLRHIFTVASFSRSTTPVVLTELEYDGIIGYGEASMPPTLASRRIASFRF